MPSEDAEMWKEIHKEEQEERANNREVAPEMLAGLGLNISVHNGGAHIVVKNPRVFGKIVDYWPGPDKWRSRCGRKGFDVGSMLRFLGVHNG